MKYGFLVLLLFKLLLLLLVEVKWERGVKGDNIPKFSELREEKLNWWQAW